MLVLVLFKLVFIKIQLLLTKKVGSTVNPKKQRKFQDINHPPSNSRTASNMHKPIRVLTILSHKFVSEPFRFLRYHKRTRNRFNPVAIAKDNKVIDLHKYIRTATYKPNIPYIKRSLITYFSRCNSDQENFSITSRIT